MPQPRKFDHDEARLRIANGESKAALAREYGVTWKAISRVVDPQARARMHAASLDWSRRNSRESCKGGCGRLIWRMGARGKTASGYCPTCYGISIAESVRPDSLRCSTCGDWKPDTDFPRHRASIARRGRHSECRLCQTISRRARRHANTEADRAYQRDYRRRKRATA